MKTFVINLTPAEAEDFCSFAYSCKYSLWYPPKAIRDYAENTSPDKFEPFRIIFACENDNKTVFARIGEYYFRTSVYKVPDDPNVVILNDKVFASVVITEKYYSKNGIEFSTENKPRFYREGIPLSAIDKRLSVNISECEFLRFSKLSFVYDVPEKTK